MSYACPTKFANCHFGGEFHPSVITWFDWYGIKGLIIYERCAFNITHIHYFACFATVSLNAAQ